MVFASVNKKAQRTRKQTCTSMDIWWETEIMGKGCRLSTWGETRGLYLTLYTKVTPSGIKALMVQDKVLRRKYGQIVL